MSTHNGLYNPGFAKVSSRKRKTSMEKTSPANDGRSDKEREDEYSGKFMKGELFDWGHES